MTTTSRPRVSREFDPAHHRTTEHHALMSAIGLVSAAGFAASVAPAVDRAINTGLLVVAVLVALGLLVQLGARWVRERIEDCADTLVGARWAAAHAAEIDPPAPRSSADDRRERMREVA